ncbi:uncharacterized mitochondrial protein AtMg00810-like [Solanum verrucosum]|uniref:uncharacterized mitochondrial protein AtMg00810-like n=1 Tax=Solanum verrucosum TaxID=315347 RepID=UPI0020D1E37C|nr:uncharacterized mitochondrial protein AtMg00810-like [Solanum verrucosum]
MDVKNTFLYGDLEEVVFMKPPPGCVLPRPNAVCHLRKSLYGLKQAPELGITRLLIYVDDIIITGNYLEKITKLKEFLHTSFKMKDLGRLTYFLRLEVLYLPTGIMLTQQKYAHDLVVRAGLTDDKVVYTPMEINTKYKEVDGEPFNDPTLYWQLVGSLVYLTMTRPDISYAVQVLSQFMINSYRIDHTTFLRLIRYIHGSMSQGVLFRSDSSIHLEGYTDANWAGCPTSRRFITGWCMFLAHP